MKPPPAATLPERAAGDAERQLQPVVEIYPCQRQPVWRWQAWSGGVNFANQLSETFAIIQAPGLENAYVNGQKYRTTNAQGTVIFDHVLPYRESSLLLNTANTQSKTELIGNRKAVAPYRGAVVLARFDTDQRQPLAYSRRTPGRYAAEIWL